MGEQVCEARGRDETCAVTSALTVTGSGTLGQPIQLSVFASEKYRFFISLRGLL